MTAQEHIKKMLHVVGLGRPCEHHNFDGSLGDGKTWARCEDCGETFKQENLERVFYAAKRWEEAMQSVLAHIDQQEQRIAGYKSQADDDLLMIVKQNAEVERLRVDAARYRWLRKALVKLSFSDSLIAALVKEQSELDAAMKETP